MSSVSRNHSSTEQTYQNSTDGILDIHSVANISDQRNEGQLKTFCLRLRSVSCEILAFLYTFSFVLTNVPSTTMILQKVCLVHLKYNSSICDDLENDNISGIKNSVEKLATNYQLGHTIIQTAPAAVLSCFIGPWSDKYGRKLPIIVGLCGMLMESIASTVCAYFLETRVEYYYIPAVFTGMFGGSVSILAVIYSYASDGSTLQKRTMKFAFIEMSVGAATALGSAAGGWIYKGLGFSAVYVLSAAVFALCLAFLIFVIQEKTGLNDEDSSLSNLKKLCSCELFLEGFDTIGKVRPHRGRLQVILLIISICFLVSTMDSTGDINYLYAHHQFEWDTTTYSNFTAMYIAVGFGMLFIVIPVLKYFRITDPFLGLVGSVSLLLKCLGVGLAVKPGFYHVANIAGVIGGCAPFAARSRISKIVSEGELGKMFTFVATAESLLPILMDVLMTQLFRACLEFFPGVPYITLACLILFPVSVFSWMLCLPKMPYEDVSYNAKSDENLCSSDHQQIIRNDQKELSSGY